MNRDGEEGKGFPEGRIGAARWRSVSGGWGRDEKAGRRSSFLLTTLQ